MDCHNIPFSLTMHTLTHTHRLAADQQLDWQAWQLWIYTPLPELFGQSPAYFILSTCCVRSCSYWKSSFFMCYF